MYPSGVDDELRKKIEAAVKGSGPAFKQLVDLLRVNTATAILEELLVHDEPVVRRAALIAARGRKDPGLAPHVAKLGHDPDKSVRVALCELLEEDVLPNLDATVVTLLQDGDEAVRAAACRSARKRPVCEGALLLVLEESGESSFRVRQAAAVALAHHRARGVLLPLFHSIATDTTRPVQQSSATTLDAHLKAVGGWPAEVALPEQPVLETVNARVAQIGVAKFPTLGPWLAHKAATETDVKKLREFGTDYLAEIEAGRLPRAYGVDSIVNTLRDVLVNGKTRGAVLLGETGAGKTAIVHELAHRLSKEPGGPWRILRSSPVEILAGTRYLGEWQTKLNDLVNLCKAPKRVILYLPNLQELADAGRTVQSDINMATALAPHIESGKLAILGESTPEAFRGGLGAIGSLRRLFHPVDVPEADLPGTRDVLERIRREAGADMPPAVLDRMIELADYYLSGVVQPGRAAGLLRRMLELHAGKTKSLGIRDVLETLSKSTGVPVDLLDDGIALDLKSVRAFFEQRVMGQTEAVDAVLDVVSLVKAGLTDPQKPFAVLFFVGPTGVGKTELARALAEYLFGDPKRMTRFDMSEFASYDAFERLIGRAHTPGLLTSAVRERPFSVLLLDEIEKAHGNVFDLCLQLFDAGRLTDAAGRTADFRRTIIILTSNVGSRIQREAALGFDSAPKNAAGRDNVQRELERVFRPEFLNRLDRIVQFAPLAEETAEKIARREVAAVLERSGITRRGLVVDVDPGALALLLREGYSATFGARPLKRTVERRVLLPVARTIAAGGAVPGTALRLIARGDKIEVEVTAADPSLPHPDSSAVRDERKSEDRAATLVERAESLRDRGTPLAARKAELLAATSEQGFWNDPVRARRILDDVHRLEGVLTALDAFDAAASAEAERLTKRRDRDPVRRRERLDALESEAARVEFLLSCRDARDLGDAYLVLSLVKSTGDGLEGVGRLAGMYAALAKRRGLSIEVLDDRRGGTPPEDTITLLVGGAGAYAMLRGEAGLHQLHREKDSRRTTSKGELRDAVRIDVLPVPGEDALERTDLRVDARPLRGIKGRLLEKPNLELTILHVPTMTSVRAWTSGPRPVALERLRPFLRARMDSGKSAEVVATTVVRRYTFGASPLVRDPRTGRSTGRLDEVLGGDLDAFLAVPDRARG